MHLLLTINYLSCPIGLRADPCTAYYGQTRAQPTMGTAYYGHSLLWAQPTMGTAYYGHSLLWAQPTMGTAYYGHSLLWAQPIMGTAYYGQPSMGTPVHSLLWGFKLPQERSMRAGQPQVHAPGARSACMQQAVILHKQHKQKQKLPEAGREAHYHPLKSQFS